MQQVSLPCALQSGPREVEFAQLEAFSRSDAAPSCRQRSHSRRIVPMWRAVTAPDVGGRKLSLMAVLPTLLAVPIPKLTIGSWNGRSPLRAPEGACRARLPDRREVPPRRESFPLVLPQPHRLQGPTSGEFLHSKRVAWSAQVQRPISYLDFGANRPVGNRCFVAGPKCFRCLRWFPCANFVNVLRFPIEYKIHSPFRKAVKPSEYTSSTSTEVQDQKRRPPLE